MEDSQPQPEQKEQPVPPVQRVIELLEIQNKMIGMLNQSVVTYLRNMSNDVEMCKVQLNKIAKTGPVEVKVNEGGSRSGSPPIPVPSGNKIPIG